MSCRVRTVCPGEHVGQSCAFVGAEPSSSHTCVKNCAFSRTIGQFLSEIREPLDASPHTQYISVMEDPLYSRHMLRLCRIIVMSVHIHHLSYSFL